MPSMVRYRSSSRHRGGGWCSVFLGICIGIPVYVYRDSSYSSAQRAGITGGVVGGMVFLCCAFAICAMVVKKQQMARLRAAAASRQAVTTTTTTTTTTSVPVVVGAPSGFDPAYVASPLNEMDNKMQTGGYASPAAPPGQYMPATGEMTQPYPTPQVVAPAPAPVVAPGVVPCFETDLSVLRAAGEAACAPGSSASAFVDAMKGYTSFYSSGGHRGMGYTLPSDAVQQLTGMSQSLRSAHPELWGSPEVSEAFRGLVLAVRSA